MIDHIHTNGKLLLTGEYFILSGAVGLAVPCHFGQTFKFDALVSTPYFTWKSYDHEGGIWFTGFFDREQGQYIKGSDQAVGQRLQEIFQSCFQLNATWEGLQQNEGVHSSLSFPRDWGLGSSSTLLAAIALWAEVDPYQLLQQTFGGSGYDLACALSSKPLLYQIHHGRGESVQVPYQPAFAENLYFIHLGKKQNSREGIQQYRKLGMPSPKLIEQISQLSLEWLNAKTLSELEPIILAHEQLVSGLLNLPRAQELYFSDFWGTIKSLGAWGGDFVLATSKRPEGETKAFFREKGFSKILTYQEMVL